MLLSPTYCWWSIGSSFALLLAFCRARPCGEPDSWAATHRAFSFTPAITREALCFLWCCCRAAVQTGAAAVTHCLNRALSTVYFSVGLSHREWLVALFVAPLLLKISFGLQLSLCWYFSLDSIKPATSVANLLQHSCLFLYAAYSGSVTWG